MEKDFFNLVRDVRKAQRRYFAARQARGRRRPTKEFILLLLEKSKALEKELDELLAGYRQLARKLAPLPDPEEQDDNV